MSEERGTGADGEPRTGGDRASDGRRAEPQDLRHLVASSARDLVRGLADRLDMEGVKEALADIESAGRRTQLTAEVRSAVPLTEHEVLTLEERLRGRFGDRLEIHYDVDPELLGGMAVRVGDHYVDGSVAARLAQLRHKLTGAGG